MGTSAVADLEREMQEPEVIAAMAMLGKRGLGVTVVHLHGADDTMSPLPDSMVQFEDDLVVSFLPEGHPAMAGSVPVTAATINGKPHIVGRCRQGHTQPPA